jgi:group I intron endonuclease
MKGVYSITNNTNGCAYIGSTAKSITRRWDFHRSMLKRDVHHNKHLQHAWNKYGEGSFNLLVLEEMSGTPEKILQHEQAWLDFHRMSGDVYNLVFHVTNTTLGYKYTNEQRQEIYDRLAKYHPMRGKHFSEEAKYNMRLGQKRGKEHHFYGKKHTKESREKMRLAQTGKRFSEEHCGNISKAKKGKKTGHKMTKEHKRILAASTSKSYPAFYNITTGEIIPPGRNLSQVCRDHGLCRRGMRKVQLGKQKQHQNWVLEDGI